MKQIEERKYWDAGVENYNLHFTEDRQKVIVFYVYTKK